MDTTDGLVRGTEVVDTGAGISVPVGPGTLGRILNVIGEPIDERGPVPHDKAYSIHREAPAFEDQATAAEILVAGRNFGCGSSREHAPWALLDYGIRAVFSSEIADIFRNNALKNGLLAVVLSESEHRYLLAHPGIELAIDVAAQTIELPDGCLLYTSRCV